MKEKLTAPETGKLWATYMGNSMSSYILSYFLEHIEDPDKKILQHAKDLTEELPSNVKEIFTKENVPIPYGLTQEDVNLGALKLFEDECHKMNMFSMKMMAFGNSVAVNGRHDLALLHGKSMKSVSSFVNDAAAIMMETSWMETPSEVVDRDHLTSN
ncbi:DUF3231 family protein [Priestia aryabhattai]|uniref:DUF3231 family protein n=1 Tax=Priestia megaterium TaxID=1404 RepID=UPI0039B99095